MKEGIKRFLFVTVLTGSLCALAEQQGRAEREAFHAAFEACLTENNLTKPERGQRPSEEHRAVMDSCLQAKGFTKPSGGPRHHEGHHPPEIQGSDGASSGQQ